MYQSPSFFLRRIEDIVDYSKRNGWSGILVAIDFEKAFDTLNFKFLIRALHKFNFGPSFPLSKTQSLQNYQNFGNIFWL